MKVKQGESLILLFLFIDKSMKRFHQELSMDLVSHDGILKNNASRHFPFTSMPEAGVRFYCAVIIKCASFGNKECAIATIHTLPETVSPIPVLDIH